MAFNPHQPTRSRRPQPSHAQFPVTPTTTAVDGGELLLYTPAEAAVLLRVRESWLRKKAAARAIPCTFLGKHLRFSPADLAAIVARAAQAPTARRPHRNRRPTPRRSDLTPGPGRSVDPPAANDHNHPEGSSPWPG